MTAGKILFAVTTGVVLATLPFLHFTHLGEHAEAHTDHEPRHGGQLGMVGDHHIELVRRRGEVQVFVSDAWRRPVQPSSGSVTFDGGAPQPLAWRNHRLVGADQSTARTIAVEVAVVDDQRIATSFDAPLD